MTHEELDAMWSIATRKSIEENQPYTRYEFAKMVAAKEREACAAVCWKNENDNAFVNSYNGKRLDLLCAEKIRARGEA